MSETEKLTIRLPADVLNRLRLAATVRKTTRTAIVRDLLGQHLPQYSVRELPAKQEG